MWGVTLEAQCWARPDQRITNSQKCVSFACRLASAAHEALPGRIVRKSKANEPQAVACIALHGLAGDVIAMAVPAGLAQTWLPCCDPVLVGGPHRRSDNTRRYTHSMAG